MITYYDENYQEVSEHTLYELYDDMLDDVAEPWTFGELSYPASAVLKEVDPIAYRCGFNDYTDSMRQDGQLYEDESEFIEELLTEWLADSVDAYAEVETNEAESELIHQTLELYSTGVLELVEGAITIHPHYTHEDVEHMITHAD